MSEIRITVTDDQGVLLDMTTLTREEFARAQGSALAAMALLDSLQIGAEVDAG